jgi:hypothetical protein
MKPLLTRAFTRNVLTATVVVAASGGLAGLGAGPVLAQTSGMATAPHVVTLSSSTGSAGPMMPPPPPGGQGHQPPPPGGQGHQPPPPGGQGYQPPPGGRGHQPPPPLHPQAELWITLRDSPQNPALTWTLTCSPSGGSLPDPSRACWELGRASAPFAPLARDVSCSMIFYGQQTVTLTGYWYGSRISIEISRTDSCQEAKWNEVIAALGLYALTGEVNPGGPMKPGPGGTPSTT